MQTSQDSFLVDYIAEGVLYRADVASFTQETEGSSIACSFAAFYQVQMTTVQHRHTPCLFRKDLLPDAKQFPSFKQKHFNGMDAWIMLIQNHVG